MLQAINLEEEGAGPGGVKERDIRNGAVNTCAVYTHSSEVHRMQVMFYSI